ncbi:MAG: aryl-sulfate sulfotransferase [Candidatus Marinimicrobia bacterium]|nr:aryl-sulfate sulfotransferase [Candidatus Neomarinimicrobiota bacterium]
MMIVKLCKSMGLMVFMGITLGNILPPEGSQLNYTQIFHRWNQFPGAEEYLLTITNINTGDSQEIMTATNSIIVDLSEWGTSYQWSACSIINGVTTENCSDVYQYSINPLPSYFPDDINISVLNDEDMQNGITIMDFESLSFSAALKADGIPVWFAPVNETMEKFVFTQFYENGNMIGFGSGYGYEINLNGEIVFQSPQTYGVHHHFNKTEDGTYFLIDATIEYQYCPVECHPSLPDEIPWQGDVFIELDDEGNTLWEWNTFNQISLSEYNPYYVQVYNGNNEMDWTHSNSVHFDPNTQSVFVSIRNLSRITKIDYSSKEIIWNLGVHDYLTEISFPEELGFSQQHSVQVLENGNLLFFDNHRYLNPELSRCMEVSINEENQSAEIVWEHVLPAHLFTGSRGECDRLENGNTLITVGRTGNTIEVTPDHEIVWHLMVNNSGFDVTMYRSERIDNLHPVAFSATIDETVVSGDELILNNDETITLNIHNQGWHTGDFVYEIFDSEEAILLEGVTQIISYETNTFQVDISSLNTNISEIRIYPQIAPEKVYIIELVSDGEFLQGDLNEDNMLNILDIVLLVNVILDGGFSVPGDLNDDGVNNILDIVILANLILDA